MPTFIISGSRTRRAALAVSYAVLLCLAGLALLDLGALLQPAAVPAMGGIPATGVEEPPAGLIGRLMSAVGLTGMKYFLGTVLPGLQFWEGARGGLLPGGLNTGGEGLLAAAFRAITDISLENPATLLAAQLTGMRGIALSSRGLVVITQDLPGEGESPPPDMARGSRSPTASGSDLSAVTAGTATGPAAGDEPAPALTGGPLVAIYHSHAMESYLPMVKQVSAGATGKMDAEEAFADDPELTIVRAGQELANILASKYGIPNVHSRRFHDAAGRVGAYVESANTVERLMAQYPTIKVLLDLHRDSPRRAVTTATVEGRSVARILLLVGSNSTLAHPNWRANLVFANRLHQVMERLYPGLSRGVLVKESRYNQHYLPHAMLVEVGGVDNSLDEVLASARLFAEVLVTALREDPTANWLPVQAERK
ncbi:MAG: stage II sporulation protein P [Bacillota bacterium]|nr:stage II sporulation protein P [Bacillota bacterium]